MGCSHFPFVYGCCRHATVIICKPTYEVWFNLSANTLQVYDEAVWHQDLKGMYPVTLDTYSTDQMQGIRRTCFDRNLIAFSASNDCVYR